MNADLETCLDCGAAISGPRGEHGGESRALRRESGSPLAAQWPRGLPGGSAGKETICNAGDSGLIPGWGRDRLPTPVFLGFPGGSVGKNPPAVRKTWVRSLGWKDPLEDGMTTHSSILAWRIPMDRGAWWATVHGLTESQTRLSD